MTKNYPVEAANSGNVAFAGDLGIYGNTVIIDHGLGLFTLYGHLSSIDIKAGDSVAKRQVLGKTGETGLAAGDHLHFGIYLDGVAVLPVEWWDQKWIDDNVKPKLEGRSGQEIAEAQQPGRERGKVAGNDGANRSARLTRPTRSSNVLGREPDRRKSYGCSRPRAACLTSGEEKRKAARSSR